MHPSSVPCMQFHKNQACIKHFLDGFITHRCITLSFVIFCHREVAAPFCAGEKQRRLRTILCAGSLLIFSVEIENWELRMPIGAFEKLKIENWEYQSTRNLKWDWPIIELLSKPPVDVSSVGKYQNKSVSEQFSRRFSFFQFSFNRQFSVISLMLSCSLQNSIRDYLKQCCKMLS